MKPIEEQLAETLDRRAADARPSADAFDRILDRVEGRERAPRRWLVPALALGTAAALVVGVVAVVGDRGGDEIVAGPGKAGGGETEGTGGPSGAAPWDRRAPFPGIWPVTTWEDYDALAQSVAEGHQPWYGDPVEVAKVYVGERGFGDHDSLGDYSEFEGGGCGRVPFDLADDSQGDQGFVQLCELSDGEESGSPLVVTSSDTSRFGYVAPPLGETLTITFGTDRPGVMKAQARAVEGGKQAGSVEGEWITESTVEMGEKEVEGIGSGEFSITLDFGPDVPEAVLVRMTHTAADDGSQAFTEFRIDGEDPYGGFLDTECSGAFPATDPAADEALLGWFSDNGSADAEVESGGETRTLVQDHFVIVGDLAREPERVEICVRTFWTEQPYDDDTAVGVSDDLFILTNGDAGWGVEEVRRGELIDLGPWRRASIVYPVASFGSTPAECGESDDEFITLDTVIVTEAGWDQLLSVALWLTTSWEDIDAPWEPALPADARLLSVEERDGVVYVDLNDAADAGGGACLQNLRTEQIRRTFLAQPGVDDVVITVEGEPGFQP